MFYDKRHMELVNKNIINSFLPKLFGCTYFELKESLPFWNQCKIKKMFAPVITYFKQQQNSYLKVVVLLTFWDL